MWDEQDGLYYDYNFVEKKVRRYPFITAFYPLWVGVADERQAARMVANLHLFERPGGLLTSTQVTRQPMGCSVRLGPYGDDCHSGAAPLWV